MVKTGGVAIEAKKVVRAITPTSLPTRLLSASSARYRRLSKT